MFQNVKSSSVGSFELPPAGNCIEGEVIAVIDLGQQKRKPFRDGDSPTWSHQVFVVWELPARQKPGGDSNHLIGKVFSVSVHEKSELGQLLRRLGYISGNETFDLTTLPKVLIGQRHQLTIEHKASAASADGSRRYARITNVSPLHPAAAAACPPAKCQRIIFDLDTDLAQGAPEMQIPSWLPYVFGQAIPNVIKLSLEWQQYGGAHSSANNAPDANPAYREGAF